MKQNELEKETENSVFTRFTYSFSIKKSICKIPFFSEVVRNCSKSLEYIFLHQMRPVHSISNFFQFRNNILAKVWLQMHTKKPPIPDSSHGSGSGLTLTLPGCLFELRSREGRLVRWRQCLKMLGSEGILEGNSCPLLLFFALKGQGEFAC